MEVSDIKFLWCVSRSPVLVSGTGYQSDATYGHEPASKTAKCWIQGVHDGVDNSSRSVSFSSSPRLRKLVRLLGVLEAWCSWGRKERGVLLIVAAFSVQ